MDKSNVEDHLKFEEFFEGRYQAKRVILSRYNYKLYEAVDTSQLNSRVFIKQLLTQKPASQSELSLHYDTIKSLQDLDSPNLFKIVNSEVKETECLLIMESFDGLNLEDYSETGPGSSSLLLVFFQVILALNELHQKSVLHINLRPDDYYSLQRMKPNIDLQKRHHKKDKDHEFLNFINDEIIPNIVDNNIGIKIDVGPTQSVLLAKSN